MDFVGMNPVPNAGDNIAVNRLSAEVETVRTTIVAEINASQFGHESLGDAVGIN
jgi:hypothetical protein